ncbi:amidohydrolase family protein [Marinitenerispora sediminis]|uniref:Amidohydrolase/deacetylase family metallohydrolase n=1 Tax=Marinitenerispora sediminis TaxID=1931232 RepID=A0A368T3F8_9ACTN|nr:amidohydrolase/deacetylase family metallohydrolase [Marinitenerispora sediminis]RCV49128.1 amidohydrolase/deacetylase family metallohydrolase [Marinitenerispora sediminis]RCV51878.1 amidohydrolase/deacetylase family metallohydrolase [Marinitenerispora sediminis]RCV57237.1 amidohydrolase/deacetylase family metallohydrolase [Marinitenerispora sediminis]
MWDLLLHGGRVIDPASGSDGTADIAVRDGKVAAVGGGLPRTRAARTVDVSGRLVLPGLVDMHTHIGHGAGYWGLAPEPVAWRTGVTTWVDAGSAGAYTLAGLRRGVADPSPLRIHAMINVAGTGLVGRTGEHHVLENLDVATAAAVAADHADLVRGVKARIDRHTVGPHGLEPLRRARQLADHLGKPLMVHIGYGPPHLADVAPLLGEGDILTHCATGVAAGLVADGRPSETLLRLREAGVVFDLGHGAGAFDFNVLEAELAAGITPVVSTDLHIRSVYGPAYDLPTVMGKAMAAGMPLADTVAAVTARPARALGLPSGTLAVGADADIAVFEPQTGPFPAVDVHGGVREAPLRLVNTATYVAGRRLSPSTAEPPPAWVPLSPAQHQAEADRQARVRTSVRHLDRPEDFDEPFPRPEQADPGDAR